MVCKLNIKKKLFYLKKMFLESYTIKQISKWHLIFEKNRKLIY